MLRLSGYQPYEDEEEGEIEPTSKSSAAVVGEARTPLTAGVTDNDDETERLQPPQPDDDEEEEEGAGYRAFRRREVKGVLYRLSPVEDPLRERVGKYVNDGAMMRDMRYVRDVYGLVNASGRVRDFEQFWEAPWVEEHVRDSARKRRLEAQQRSMAVRSYIRNAPTDPDNLGRYLDSVDKLTEWEDRHGAKDLVKTVSRMVQSFERLTLTHLKTMLETSECRSLRHASVFVDPAEADRDVTALACTLRRSDYVFHLFAAAVAMEILWNEGTNGTRNTTIFMCRQLEDKRLEAAAALLRALATNDVDVSYDTLGLPLMEVNGSMCVARGVLVVMPGSVSATYVLDVERAGDGGQALDLTGVKTITITHVLDADKDAPPPSAAKKQRR